MHVENESKWKLNDGEAKMQLCFLDIAVSVRWLWNGLNPRKESEEVKEKKKWIKPSLRFQSKKEKKREKSRSLLGLLEIRSDSSEVVKDALSDEHLATAAEEEEKAKLSESRRRLA